jgi:hypothetical protein
MQGLVGSPRRVNALLGRRAPAAQRHHARRCARRPRWQRRPLRAVSTPDITASAGVVMARVVDPPSALWFDGWKAAIRTDAPWLRALAKEGRPTADPHTWLLAIGWRRGGGLIGIDDVPGPAP